MRTTASTNTRVHLTGTGATTYGYDVYNRLTAAGSATLSYDPVGRLYETAGGATTRFAYDGLDLIGEYNTSGALLRRYVHGPSFDEPLVWYEGSGTTDRRWLTSDQLGSVVAVTNASGAATNINTYDEYGTPGSSNIGRFQYTGQAWIAEASFHHYKARAYSPALGRFLQTDPILFGGGMSLYAYVENDPINWRDPLGLQRSPTDPPTEFPEITVIGFSCRGRRGPVQETAFGILTCPDPRGGPIVGVDPGVTPPLNVPGGGGFQLIQDGPSEVAVAQLCKIQREDRHPTGTEPGFIVFGAGGRIFTSHVEYGPYAAGYISTLPRTASIIEGMGFTVYGAALRQGSSSPITRAALYRPGHLGLATQTVGHFVTSRQRIPTHG